MATRTLGRTGMQVSALSLGTAELGLDYGISAPGHPLRPSTEDAVGLVQEAVDSGLNFLDTARVYGNSEEILGRALASRWMNVYLATKTLVHAPNGTVPPHGELARFMLKSLDCSLLALRRDYVDVWYIHNVDARVLERIEEVKEVFDSVKASGKVRWTGATVYGTKMPLACLRLDVFDVLQVAYSVLDQRISDQILPLAAEHNVGIVARSVLLKGVLTDRADSLPRHLDELRKRSLDFRRLVTSSGLGISCSQAAIAFVLSEERVHSALIGVSSRRELQEDIRATEVCLPATLRTQLRALLLDDAELLNPSTWRLS